MNSDAKHICYRVSGVGRSEEGRGGGDRGGREESEMTVTTAHVQGAALTLAGSPCSALPSPGPASSLKLKKKK